MKKAELIAEAKKRYPIGTVFTSPVGSDSKERYTVREFSNSEGGNGWYTNQHIIIYVEGITGYGKYLYLNGKWADIISYPEEYVPECQ